MLNQYIQTAAKMEQPAVLRELLPDDSCSPDEVRIKESVVFEFNGALNILEKRKGISYALFGA